VHTAWGFTKGRSGATCAGPQQDGLETYVRQDHNRRSPGRGFERLVLWKRGVDSQLFRPDRPGGKRVRRGASGQQDDVVIAYVSRLRREKNIITWRDASR